MRGLTGGIVTGALLVASALAPSALAATSLTYGVDALSIGALGGQDNWVSVSMGSGGAQRHEVLVPGVTVASQNTAVNGHDGSLAIRQPYGGGSVTSRSTRVNDGSFDFSPVTGSARFTVELDLYPPCWGGHFALGKDADGDGDLVPNTETGVRLIVYRGCFIGYGVRLIGPDGTTTTDTTSYTGTDLYRYRLVFDIEADTVSVSRRNLATNGAWTELPALQDVTMGFTSDGSRTDPSAWDAMMLLSDSWDPASLFDNITFTDNVPASVDYSQAPPPWMKQYQRSGDEQCLPEWGPSWAEWAYSGTGGPVCTQTWWWEPTGWVVR